MRQFAAACFVVILVFSAISAAAADYAPDLASVQREGPAYRYPQAGWIVVHVEGDAYERGRQQGKLLWREIQNYVKCFASQHSGTAPAESWPLIRTMTDALFVRKFDPELLEEMKGIADGAAAGGAKFDGRPLDLTDIVAINIWPEMLTLNDALRAQPTGLEGKEFGNPLSNAKPATQVARCSAFAATGPATRDGKPIIGHVTMFDQYPCNFFNVWLDVKPTHGHRLIFQAAPGSVQSGMDWYINDAGIVLTETTINQTRFDPNGLSEGSRSRRAMQYGDSIESVVRILGDDGNGLYTNEWLLADMHTSEIALFELGTKTSRLMRSSKNEWFGGTAGFYWGNNNTKDLAVRGETIAAANDRPADMTFCPEVRDQAWIGLYEQYKGKMDADFGRFAFSRPPLISRDSCDAKFATADMALRMESAAHWGDPYGQLWSPSPDGKAPDATPIVPNDWTLLKIKPPVKPATQPSTVAVDLIGVDDDGGDKNDTEPPPAWHGTLLPAGDGDIWLTSAFAAFHEYAARDNQMLKGVGDGDERSVNTDDLDRLTQRQRDELALSLFRYRSMATSQRNPQQSVPLRNIRSDVADDKWYRSATGRGVMLLSDLRRRLGEETFDKAMDAFGRAHAGRPVDSNAFVVAMSSTGVPGLDAFFARWLDTADALPTLEIKSALSTEKESKFVVSGTIVSHGGCTPAAVDVTVETHEGETTTAVPFTSNTADFHLPADNKPTRLVVNKYGRNACTNGWVWAASSYMRDLDHTIIVYGTRVEATANRIAAEKLQQGIVDRWEHLQIPIKADTQVGDDELRGHHVLLVGRPECSELIERFAGGLPVVFGPRSFSVRGQLYANADTAVIAAGVNPLDDRYSFVCVAGLNPGATLRAAVTLPDDSPAPLKLLPANQGSRSIVPPAVELTREFH